jgi:hypothetical protein
MEYWPQLNGFENIEHDIDKTRRRQNEFIDDTSVTRPTRLSLRTLRDSTSFAFAQASFAVKPRLIIRTVNKNLRHFVAMS